MRLNLRRAFKNVQDARIAQHAADLELQRVAIAAVDLQAGVGIAPGDAGGQQFGHAGFDVAAVAFVFFGRCKVGQLASHHGLGQHQSQLVGHARELDDGLAKLAPVAGVAQRQVIGLPGDTDGACGGLHPCAFKGLHQLLEALTRHATEQAVSRHGEIVEGNLILLHAAITQHRNLAAAHARRGKRLVLAATRLARQQQAQAAVAFVGGAGACQHGHQVAARAMGDPGLVAVNAPCAIDHLRGAGAQRAQVGAGVGLGEHRRGQHLARGNAGQPAGLLPRRAGQ